MDYNFVTVERFMELEKSGALLESGTYEGKTTKVEEKKTGVLAGTLISISGSLSCGDSTELLQ